MKDSIELSDPVKDLARWFAEYLTYSARNPAVVGCDTNAAYDVALEKITQAIHSTNTSLLEENERLREAIEKAPHGIRCGPAPYDPCNCWKSKVQEQTEVDPWLPIESAPKDGTPVWLWIVHDNLKYCDPKDWHLWNTVVEGRWIDHHGGGLTWHGLSGVARAWQPQHRPAPPTVEASAHAVGQDYTPRKPSNGGSDNAENPGGEGTEKNASLGQAVCEPISEVERKVIEAARALKDGVTWVEYSDGYVLEDVPAHLMRGLEYSLEALKEGNQP